MRLVNVDELIEQEKVFAEKYKGDFGEQVATHVIEILTNAPTADDWQKYSDALWKKAYERGKSDAVPVIRCKDCRYFEYDHVEHVGRTTLILTHEICTRWGEGCKTSENGYCFMAERK